MRYLYVLLSSIILSSCAQQTSGMLPLSRPPLDRRVAAPLAEPQIMHVSRITDHQYQTIVISGNGFGTMSPYNGDSGYLQILDTTGGWSAGYISSAEVDSVHLDVTGWSDNKITIAGFTGAYGQSYWYLTRKDHLAINVWNAQTGNGPATAKKKVK